MFGVCSIFYSFRTCDISNTTVVLIDRHCAKYNIFVGLLIMSIEIPPFMYVLSIVLSQHFTMFCIIYYVLAMQSLVYVAYFIHSVLLTFLTLRYRCSD